MGNCCEPQEKEVDGEAPIKTVKRPQEIVRLFLIGSGEAGKSTIIKQMQKLCEINPKDYQMYNEEWQPISDPIANRRDWTKIVHQNTLRVITILIQKAAEFGYEYSSAELKRCADDILEFCGDDPDTIHLRANTRVTPDLAAKIERLWTDSDGPISRTMQRRKEFVISDSTNYFLNVEKLHEISHANYVPSTDDIIRARDPTVDIHDYNFLLHRVHFSIHDMGGQPVEQAKLPQFLSSWLQNTRPGDRNFILYMAALSDYNQMHPKHPDRTRLDESIARLQVLLNMRELERCGFILFLNKRDIFEQKLTDDNDFSRLFEKYMDKKSSKKSLLNQAEKAVASKFAEAVSETRRLNDTLYCRFTCAVDTQMMEAIFGAVRNDIIHDLIRQGNWVPFP
uniref:Uncharacterized protein n=1 Tax=Plectus sambesii TaxID=2011161 RepID=A0A914WFX8_9BILA